MIIIVIFAINFIVVVVVVTVLFLGSGEMLSFLLFSIRTSNMFALQSLLLWLPILIRSVTKTISTALIVSQSQRRGPTRMGFLSVLFLFCLLVGWLACPARGLVVVSLSTVRMSELK